MQASQHVSHQRINQRMADMAAIGATAKGGVNRQALSIEDARAQILLADWGSRLGLAASRDEVGNMFLRLPGADDGLPPVLTGSHMDTQPTGGRYDGIYGVMAGLEAIEAIIESGVPPKRPIELVAWANEEGSRFAPSLMGSGAHVGARDMASVHGLRDAEGVSVLEALKEIEPMLAHIAPRPLGGPAHCCVEAHIEQGSLLERENLIIGVVTGIQGKHTYRVTVSGEAAHAGTTPHRERRDALLAAAAMAQALSQQFHDPEDITRFTIGRFTVAPNAPSVVPSEVVFSIDLRHPSQERLARLSDFVPTLCNRYAGPCAVKVERLYTADPIVFPESIQALIGQAAQALSLPHRHMLSAAGHDAGLVSRICPTGMIFIPSIGGITHNETEYSRPEDVTAGARVLADVLARLAAR